MHPENGPRCALRALAEASHNHRECGQDIAPACKPPHATATVVLARPSEFPSPSYPSEGEILSLRDRRRRKKRIGPCFNFSSRALHHTRKRPRIELVHSSRSAPFALLILIFHTYLRGERRGGGGITHSHDTTRGALSNARNTGGVSARQSIYSAGRLSPKIFRRRCRPAASQKPRKNRFTSRAAVSEAASADADIRR